jgi:uncharacterized protein YbjT (DUF2867 family)
MRVFLTGGTGLIGSHLAALLRERDHQVAALARPESDTRFLDSVGAELVRMNDAANWCTHSTAWPATGPDEHGHGSNAS